jgi:hypothetical protein
MSKEAQSKQTKTEKIVNPKNYFILGNGGVIKNIKELAEIIEHLSDDEFRYHINDKKNDFANWIKDIFDEKELANKLFATKDKKDTQIILLKFLVSEG